MTRVLPSKATDVLAGRHEAAKIAETLTVAYWLHGRDDNTARYLLARVHEDFAALAAALGYTIAPIAAKARGASMTAPRIVTSAIYGPWTVWSAWDDDLGADCSPIGTGATEAEAIEDFHRQVEDAAA